MSNARRYLLGAAGVITGAAVAGFGSGLGGAYGRHLMESGQVPLPGAPRRGRRKVGVCTVALDAASTALPGRAQASPDLGFRAVALCDGREVGERMVEIETVSLWDLTPRCRKNVSAQRRQYGLRAPEIARIAWIGLDDSYRNTGLGTRLYELIRTTAYEGGFPLAPDACFDLGETSDAAWRVWQRKFGWEGRTNRRRRRLP